MISPETSTFMMLLNFIELRKSDTALICKQLYIATNCWLEILKSFLYFILSLPTSYSQVHSCWLMLPYSRKPAIFIYQTTYFINSHDNMCFHPYQLLTYHIQMGHDINLHNSGGSRSLHCKYRWCLILTFGALMSLINAVILDIRQ